MAFEFISPEIDPYIGAVIVIAIFGFLVYLIARIKMARSEAPSPGRGSSKKKGKGLLKRLFGRKKGTEIENEEELLNQLRDLENQLRSLERADMEDIARAKAYLESVKTMIEKYKDSPRALKKIGKKMLWNRLLFKEINKITKRMKETYKLLDGYVKLEAKNPKLLTERIVNILQGKRNLHLTPPGYDANRLQEDVMKYQRRYIPPLSKKVVDHRAGKDVHFEEEELRILKERAYLTSNAKDIVREKLIFYKSVHSQLKPAIKSIVKYNKIERKALWFSVKKLHKGKADAVIELIDRIIQMYDATETVLENMDRVESYYERVFEDIINKLEGG